jgi:hypothetical protein
MADYLKKNYSNRKLFYFRAIVKGIELTSDTDRAMYGTEFGDIWCNSEIFYDPVKQMIGVKSFSSGDSLNWGG